MQIYCGDQGASILQPLAACLASFSLSIWCYALSFDYFFWPSTTWGKVKFFLVYNFIRHHIQYFIQANCSSCFASLFLLIGCYAFSFDYTFLDLALPRVQVNLCQKLLFLQNMRRTCCVQKLFRMSKTGKSLSEALIFASNLEKMIFC